MPCGIQERRNRSLSSYSHIGKSFIRATMSYARGEAKTPALCRCHFDGHPARIIRRSGHAVLAAFREGARTTGSAEYVADSVKGRLSLFALGPVESGLGIRNRHHVG